ncbi:hypothetical protein [Streptomyces sp. NPDC001675]
MFLDKQCSSDRVVASIHVWEADQSGSRWYDALQQALNQAVEAIDAILDNPVGSALDPSPLSVSIAFEVAELFISLMDVLRNKDDLSCSRTFVLTRRDMTVLSRKLDLEWNFDGDGHHRLHVRYTGERPSYPTGSISCLSRTRGQHRARGRTVERAGAAGAEDEDRAPRRRTAAGSTSSTPATATWPWGGSATTAPPGHHRKASARTRKATSPSRWPSTRTSCTASTPAPTRAFATPGSTAPNGATSPESKSITGAATKARP